MSSCQATDEMDLRTTTTGQIGMPPFLYAITRFGRWHDVYSANAVALYTRPLPVPTLLSSSVIRIYIAPPAAWQQGCHVV